MDTVDQLSASGTAAQSVVDPHAAALQEGNVQQFVAAAPPLPLPDAPFTFENIFELKDVTQLCRKFRTFLCELRFAAFQTPVALLLLGERGVGKRHVARTLADEAKFELVRMVALDDNTCQHSITRQKMSLSAAFERASLARPSVLLIVDVEKLSPIRLSTAIDDANAKKGFLFIGTSNDRKRAVEVFANIDESLCRKMEIPLPLEPRRRRLFEHFTSGKIALNDDQLNKLSQDSFGFSATQILATVNRAGAQAILDRVPLTFSYFDKALVEITRDVEKSWDIPGHGERAPGRTAQSE